MKKKVKKPKFIKLLTSVNIDAIYPFKEIPCEENEEKKNAMDASKLFSYFTADIIKEDVVFIR
jgi:hypothetical protein